jgi:hypothetical protein
MTSIIHRLKEVQMETRERKHKPMYLSGLKIVMAIAMMMLMAAPAAWAVGTPSGTQIDNSASIDYEVLGATQGTITSTVASFRVDNRVDLTVASLGNTNVAANQTGAAIGFTVTNTGNTEQGYLLEAVSGTTNIPMDTPVAIYIEDGTTVGFQSGEDTLYTGGTNAGDLDPNGGTDQMTVYIVADAPAGATSGNTDTWWLRATTTDSGSVTVTTNDTNPDIAMTVQNVLADADADGAGAVDGLRDGRHAASGDFVVVAASLGVTKTHTVISDPINGTSNPKAIPGAIIEYTVNITNAAGGAMAENVTISDDLSALVTGSPAQMAFEADSYGAGLGIRMRLDTGGGWGAWTNLTNASDPDAADWNVTAVNTVTADCGDLDATHRAEVQFRLAVQ